jgi:hypothetical protein
MPSSTKLSSSVTINDYEAMVEAEDFEGLGRFVRERFDERYFLPVDSHARKHGFACLMIETLESFYQGLGDTKGKSGRMFRDHFARGGPLGVLGEGGDWFYIDVRCGILHQGEVRNGWRVLRSGDPLDNGKRTINATRVLRAVRAAVDDYSRQLGEEPHWSNFKKKMTAICANCE